MNLPRPRSGSWAGRDRQARRWQTFSLRNPRLLLLDDPTKGVDVNTKAEFYRLLVNLCEKGLAVLFYSSDDEELIGLCDRVLVMQDGVIRSTLAGETLTKANLVAASLGASEESMRLAEDSSIDKPPDGEEAP